MLGQVVCQHGQCRLRQSNKVCGVGQERLAIVRKRLWDCCTKFQVLRYVTLHQGNFQCLLGHIVIGSSLLGVGCKPGVSEDYKQRKTNTPANTRGVFNMLCAFGSDQHTCKCSDGAHTINAHPRQPMAKRTVDVCIANSAPRKTSEQGATQ